MLNQVKKKLVKRIKELQKQLVAEQKDASVFGGFSDCGDFYNEAPRKTQAVIDELIQQKISIEKWRKSLKE